jgi:hypothetical protein
MTEGVGLFRASSAIAPALPYYLYPYRHALHPSGHLQKAQMFKFALFRRTGAAKHMDVRERPPDEFVEPSSFIHPTFSSKHKKTPKKWGSFMFGGRGGI